MVEVACKYFSQLFRNPANGGLYRLHPRGELLEVPAAPNLKVERPAPPLQRRRRRCCAGGVDLPPPLSPPPTPLSRRRFGGIRH
uniref:Uncharacterized protein n=1 Tax=Arundo donax TaxID=35708 RepID=A0A0A9BY64_ARUDO